MKNSKLKQALKSLNVKNNNSIQKLTTEEVKVVKGGRGGDSISDWCLINCGTNNSNNN